MKKLLTSSGLIFLLVWTATAQTARFGLDRDTIRYGEQAVLQIDVTRPADSLKVVFPDTIALQGLDLVKISPVDTLKRNGQEILARRYYITGWDTGTYVLPSLHVRIGDSAYKWNPPALHVAGVEVDSARQAWFVPKQPLAPAQPAKTVHAHPSRFRYALLLILALVAIALGWFFYKRRQQTGPESAADIYRHALAEWDELYQNRHQYTDADSFYVKLTAVLRRYLEKVLGIPAWERISKDLIRDLEQYRFPGGQTFERALIEELRQMFQRADLAKFAKANPPLPQREADLQAVQRFLEYAQTIVDEMERQREEEQRRLEAEQKRLRRRKLMWQIPLAIAIVTLAGWGIYHAFRQPIRRQLTQWAWQWHQVPPATQWYSLSYGASPALQFNSPVVPVARPVKDTLARQSEAALLTGQIGRMPLIVLTAQPPAGDTAAENALLQWAANQVKGLPVDQIKTSGDGSIQTIEKDGHTWMIRLWDNNGMLRMIALQVPHSSFYEEVAGLIMQSARVAQPQNQGQ